MLKIILYLVILLNREIQSCWWSSEDWENGDKAVGRETDAPGEDCKDGTGNSDLLWPW